MIIPLIKTCSLIHTPISTQMNCPGSLHLRGKKCLLACLTLLEPILHLVPARLDLVR